MYGVVRIMVDVLMFRVAGSTLDLELLSSISSVNNTRGIKENQIESMIQLNFPGNLEHVVSFFVPVSDAENMIKRDLMAPVLERDKVFA